ncbi:MAG: hypothetical protein J6T29_03280, partial [Alphaproteobacteria bacterium]|nr:hypothetical protein [Alphaproteobacteria bacterium]
GKARQLVPIFTKLLFIPSNPSICLEVYHNIRELSSFAEIHVTAKLLIPIFNQQLNSLNFLSILRKI